MIPWVLSLVEHVMAVVVNGLIFEREVENGLTADHATELAAIQIYGQRVAGAVAQRLFTKHTRQNLNFVKFAKMRNMKSNVPKSVVPIESDIS